MRAGSRLVFCLASAVTLTASPARAVDRQDFHLRLEGAYAGMISSPQREQGEFGNGFHLRAAVGWQAAPILEVQLGYGYWSFPRPGADRRGGALLSPFAGLRINLPAPRGWTFATQFAAGPQWTGGDLRFGGDAGLAVEYAVTPWLALGVATRIGATFASSDESTAAYWSGGLSLTLRVPPPDQDRDNVPDSEDDCPTESSGEFSDPARPGCALDSDRDGIADEYERCLTPEGQFNPNVHGCEALRAVIELSLRSPPSSAVPSPGAHDSATTNGGSFHPTVTAPVTPPVVAPPREPDRDGDGYGDAHDACVDSRETFNGVDDQDGCPDGLDYVRLQDQVVRFEAVPRFTGDSLNTRDEGTLRALRALGALLQARCTPSATISIRADVGEAGTATAQARGNSVVAWLRAHPTTDSAARCAASVQWNAAVFTDAINPVLIEVRLP